MESATVHDDKPVQEFVTCYHGSFFSSVGNISELKDQHEKELAEFNKAQETNKARMDQGLQEKLAARRSRKRRQELHEQQS